MACVLVLSLGLVFCYSTGPCWIVFFFLQFEWHAVGAPVQPIRFLPNFNSQPESDVKVNQTLSNPWLYVLIKYLNRPLQMRTIKCMDCLQVFGGRKRLEHFKDRHLKGIGRACDGNSYLQCKPLVCPICHQEFNGIYRRRLLEQHLCHDWQCEI